MSGFKRLIFCFFSKIRIVYNTRNFGNSIFFWGDHKCYETKRDFVATRYMNNQNFNLKREMPHVEDERYINDDEH